MVFSYWFIREDVTNESVIYSASSHKVLGYITWLYASQTFPKNTRVDPLSPICRRNSYKQSA